MELKVIEKTKSKLILDIIGENHSLSNALKEELYNDSKVEGAGYFVEHPEIGIPRMVIETKGKDPVKALQEAAMRLVKKNDKFLKLFTKEIK